MKLFLQAISISVFVTGLNCNGQKTQSKTAEYNFLESVLRSHEEKIVCSKTVPLTMNLLENISEEVNLSARDSVDIQKQINYNNSSIFNFKKSFAGKTFLDDSAIIKNFRPPAYRYLKISKPIFFNGGSKAIIFIEEHCGDLCGSGVIEIYRKDQQSYMLLFRKTVWIS